MLHENTRCNLPHVLLVIELCLFRHKTYSWVLSHSSYISQILVRLMMRRRLLLFINRTTRSAHFRSLIPLKYRFSSARSLPFHFGWESIRSFLVLSVSCLNFIRWDNRNRMRVVCWVVYRGFYFYPVQRSLRTLAIGSVVLVLGMWMDMVVIKGTEKGIVVYIHNLRVMELCCSECWMP